MTRGRVAPPKPDAEARKPWMSGVSPVPLLKHFARGLGAALAAASLAAAAPAFAQIAVSTDYRINLPNYAVTNLVIMDLGSPFAALTESSPTFPLAAGVGTTT